MSLAVGQIRDARLWAGLELGELASQAGRQQGCSAYAEAMYGVSAWSEAGIVRVRAGLEAAGVEFIQENDGEAEVQLREAEG